MAGKFTVGTPNTLEKVWNIDVEREYRKLSYLFQNPERNNGIITESFKNVHTPAEHNNHVSLLFRRECEIAWEVISLLLELLQSVMKQKNEGFAKVA